VQADSSARPTVGREAELEQLEAALDAPAQEGSVCVALEGEPGIGKTRLLAELRRRAEDRGCLVLAGSATEFERDLPFSVWADALDAYVDSQELSLHEAWDAEAVGELAEVLPSLPRAAGGARRSVADERYRAHRAVRKLLELLAADRPLVVVLDDLHWSDGASLELLGALLRRGRTLASCSRSPFGEDRRPRACRPRLQRRRRGGLRSESSARRRRPSC
jgi:predicted ATPase